MRPKFGRILINAVGFLVLATVCAANDESPSGETLISQARSRELWVEGTRATRLRGQIEVAGVNGTVAQGDYAVNWVSPSQWREEIRFANYQRMRIYDGRGYWQTATVGYQPYLLYLLTGLLDLKEALTIRLKPTLGKVKNRQRDGIQQRCFNVKWTRGINDRVLCFDNATGALVAIEYLQGELQNPPEVSRIEYRDFRSVAGKLIPFGRLALKDGKTVASVKIVEVKDLNPVNPSEFTPPSNADFWPQCDDMQDEQFTEHDAPKYPEAARRNREMGRVILYGVVETDGTLSHLTVIKGATPGLNQAVMEGAGRWHYKPAQCAGNPIRLETLIASQFWLQY